MSRHSFNPEIAKQIGLNAAVIYQNIVFWCEKNAASERNIHDGNAWTYNSISAFEALFPYLSGKQIRTALDKLEESKLLDAGNFNKDRRDRTKWYSLNKETIAFAQMVKCHLPKRADPFALEGKPLPDIKPDNKQQIPQTPTGAISLFPSEELPEAKKTEAAGKEKPDDGFGRFWQAYPKKAGKPAARKAWDKAIKKADPEKIIAAAKRYAAWLSEPCSPGDFRPHPKHPQGWLNDERFNDPEVSTNRPRPAPKEDWEFWAGGQG